MTSTVLVTGANRGIGLEFCKQYLASGFLVYATCRSPEKAQELQELGRQYESKLTICPLDVTCTESITALCDNHIQDASIDIIVNNAGILGPKGVFDPESCPDQATIDQWLETFHTNSIAPMVVSLALLRNLEKGNTGKIAMVSSCMGSISQSTEDFHYAYRSSKAALNSAAKSLAISLATRDVKVILLHPGWVQTDMGGSEATLRPEQSVAGMRKVIDACNSSDPEDLQMLDYRGKSIPW